MSTIKFFYNGMKVNGEKTLCKAWYHFQERITGLKGQDIPTHVTIYAREFSGFPTEVRDHFEIQNNTDSMTDYFEKDRITVETDHPLFKVVLAAWVKGEKSRVKRWVKRGVNPWPKLQKIDETTQAYA